MSGRKARAEAAAVPASLRLSPLERQRLDMAAKASGQRRADFMRDAIVTATEEILEVAPTDDAADGRDRHFVIRNQEAR